MIDLRSTKPSALGAWLLATRPKTLVAGVMPVSVGSALALSLLGFAAFAVRKRARGKSA